MNLTELLKEFEETRHLMNQKATEYGLNHPIVIEISHQLDQIHNEILRIKQKEGEEGDYHPSRPKFYFSFEDGKRYIA